MQSLTTPPSFMQELWALLFECINVLVEGSSRSIDTSFQRCVVRRTNTNEVSQFFGKKMPPIFDLPFQTGHFLLRHHRNLAKPAVDEVRHHKVNNSERATKGDGRLTAVAGEQIRTRPFAARQNHCQHIINKTSLPVAFALRSQSVVWNYWLIRLLILPWIGYFLESKQHRCGQHHDRKGGEDQKTHGIGGVFGGQRIGDFIRHSNKHS